MSNNPTAILMRLEETIRTRKASAPDESYTASLLHKGSAHCARKFGEEAIETVIAATSDNSAALINESADVLFHLLVLLVARDVSFERVCEELANREGVSGHTEKAGRSR